MFQDVVLGDGFECSRADMECDGRGFYPFFVYLLKKRSGEMEAGGGCGNGAIFFGVDGLVAFTIFLFGIVSFDIWRQWDEADCVEEIADIFF